MFEVRGQGFGARPHYDCPCRSRGSRDLIRMPRSHSLPAMMAISTVRQKTCDDRIHFRKVNLKLFVFPSLSQFAAAFWATWQFGNLRLIHFLQTRFGSLYKTALPCLASRTLRVLHPMSARKRCRLSLACSFKFFHFRLQKPNLFLQLFILFPQQCVLLLQHFILLSQTRIVGQYLSQLLLQLRKLVSIPSRHDVHQFTIHTTFLTRVFQPVFSKTFVPSQNYAFSR